MQKFIKALCCVLCTALVLSACSFLAFCEGELSVSARSAILIEAESGRVLYRKSADTRLPMASTTKIMTAVIALEKCRDLQKQVKVDARAVGVEGSSIYLYEGEMLTMENLIYALLLSSANDAAVAIACEVAGSVEGFADLMNEKAHELGLSDTHFTNPNGLHDDDHYTTARDLANLTAYALKNKTFKEMTSTKKKAIPMLEGEGTRLLVNHNKMLSMYEGAIGVKTGFTKKSGRCLVSAAERDGLTLIAVTLNAPNDWNDHKNLLDFGFKSYEKKHFASAGELCFDVPLISGEETTVKVKNSRDISAFLSREHGDIKEIVELPRFAFASIKEGEVLGRIVYMLDGREIAEAPLIAEKSVNAKKYKKNIFDIF